MSDTLSALTGGLANPGLSNAAALALSNGATTGAGAGASVGASAAATTTGASAASQLTGNENTFLSMLMTQLKNQDPTSPMDTSQFTTELVQFSSVEQQINTNSSLTQLIQLTQSGELLQGSSIVGHTVAVANSDMAVQNGSGQIQFTAPSNEAVTVSVSNSAGTLLNQSQVVAAKGVNTWSWNALSSTGATQPDGDYKVKVTSVDSTGATTTIPFNAVGKATGVAVNGTTLNLQMGPVTTKFANVQSVLN